MPPVDQATRSKAVELIVQLRDPELDDDQLSVVYGRLRDMLPDPNFMDYTIDAEPELTPDEVVDRAFSYRPISL